MGARVAVSARWWGGSYARRPPYRSPRVLVQFEPIWPGASDDLFRRYLAGIERVAALGLPRSVLGPLFVDR